MNIKSFFKTGEFYTHLQESLDKLTSKTKKNAKAIKKLYNNDFEIIHNIDLLKQENKFLKDRIDQLEKKLWEVNTSSIGKQVYLEREKDRVKNVKSLSLPKK